MWPAKTADAEAARNSDDDNRERRGGRGKRHPVRMAGFGCEMPGVRDGGEGGRGEGEEGERDKPLHGQTSGLMREARRAATAASAWKQAAPV
jgi:hypothetical protein